MPKGCLGLDIGHSQIRVVEMVRRRKTPALTGFGCCPTPPGSYDQGRLVNPQAVGSALQQLVRSQRFGAKTTVLGLTSSEIVVKEVQFPVMKRQELAQTLSFELEELSGFSVSSPEEVVYSYDVLRTDGTEQTVLFVCCRRSLIEPFVQAVTAAGLELAAIELHGLALPRLLQADRDKARRCFIDFGEVHTTVYLEDQGVFSVYRILPLGAASLTEAVMDAFALDDTKEAVVLKHGHSIDELLEQGTGSKTRLRSMLQQLIGGILQTLDFYRARGRASSIQDLLDELLLAGGTAGMKGFAAMIAEETELQVRVLDPRELTEVAEGLEQPESCSAVAAAAALALREV